MKIDLMVCPNGCVKTNIDNVRGKMDKPRPKLCLDLDIFHIHLNYPYFDDPHTLFKLQTTTVLMWFVDVTKIAGKRIETEEAEEVPDQNSHKGVKQVFYPPYTTKRWASCLASKHIALIEQFYKKCSGVNLKSEPTPMFSLTRLVREQTKKTQTSPAFLQNGCAANCHHQVLLDCQFLETWK